MQRAKLSKFYLLTWLAMGLVPELAMARLNPDKEANPTFAFDLTFGFSTFKSEIVQQNDTSTGLTYSLSGTAGLQWDLLFAIEVDTTSTSFLINESSNEVTWQDSIMAYRMGNFHLGINFSQLQMLVNNAGTDVIDMAGSGMGGVAGVYIPVGKIGFFYINVVTASLSSARNALEQEVTGGARQDIDLGGNFDITRDTFDFIVGYKQRTFGISTTEAYVETYLITYFGVKMSLYF